MIYTPEEYAAAFTFGGRHLSKISIKRRCRSGQLPAGHVAHRKKGFWVIEVQKIPEALMKQFNVSLKLKQRRYELDFNYWHNVGDLRGCVYPVEHKND